MASGDLDKDLPYSEGDEHYPSALVGAAVHDWLLAHLDEAEKLVAAEPNFSEFEKVVSYIMGEQLREREPSYVMQPVINRCGLAVRRHVSALTDVKPMFGYGCDNPDYEITAAALSDYARLWWLNDAVDAEAGDVVRFALAGGCGDLSMEWDPVKGDVVALASDPRDTLPYRPGKRSRSIQQWEGVTLRRSLSYTRLVNAFPDKIAYIRPPTDRFSGVAYRHFQPKYPTSASGMGQPPHTLSGLGKHDPNKQRAAYAKMPDVVVYFTYLNDRRINQTGRELLIGKPRTVWAYPVPPGAALYPYKRLIVWTEYGTLYDGPCPYKTGLYPVTRLTLDPWPWSFTGRPLLADLLPLQDTINKLAGLLGQNIVQHINRVTVFEKGVSDQFLKEFDPRKPLQKVKRGAAFQGNGVQYADVAQAPGFSLEYLAQCVGLFDELSGIANLTQLLQLRQSPSADTLEKYMEALTPELRLEARQMEFFLRGVADQFKGLVLQYYTPRKRLDLLGVKGRTLAELDQEPLSLVPSQKPPTAPPMPGMPPTPPGMPPMPPPPGGPRYDPTFDAKRPFHERIRAFANLFKFYVQPNSLLAINAQERRLEVLQLSRQGMVDFWTLHEAFGTPNVGAPPMIALPVVELIDKVAAGQPVPLEFRVPITITERLMAQAQLGIGMTQSPVGRKASGEAPPEIEQKGDGSTTVRESKK